MAILDIETAAEEIADIVVRIDSGDINGAEAAVELAPILAALLVEITVPGLAREVRRVIAGIDGLVITDGPPSDETGEIGSVALDLINSMFYPPKTADGWTEAPYSLFGPTGPAATIEIGDVATLEPGEPAAVRNVGTEGAAILEFDLPVGLGPIGPTPDIQVAPSITLAPGADVVVEISGTPEEPILEFSIPQGDQGATGQVPNVSANLVMIPNGELGTVVRTGPDNAPVLTFNIPSPLDGADGREVEFNVSATHIQTRYVGEAVWVDLISIAALKGDKGDTGDGLEIDARGANLAARAAFDAQPADFTFLDLETGDLYWRETAVPGVWSSPVNIGGVANAILDALGAMDGTPGLVEQTGASSFTKRTIGAASDSSIPTRLDADGRYRRQGVTIAQADITNLAADLGAKADAAAVVAALSGKQGLDATLTAVAGLTLAADKLIYGTGADAAALTDFTGVARTLLGQTTQALMRSTGLGLGALAVKATVATADLDADAVTFAKIQNIATARLLGRTTAGAGDVEELTGAQVRALTGAISSVNGQTPDGAGNLAITIASASTVAALFDYVLNDALDNAATAAASSGTPYGFADPLTTNGRVNTAGAVGAYFAAGHYDNFQQEITVKGTSSADGSASTTTTKNVPLPSGSAAVGDRVLLIVNNPNAGTVTATLGGEPMTVSAGVGNTPWTLYRDLTGVESAAGIVVSTTVATKLSAVAYRLGNAAADAPVSATATVIDPPSVTAPWGAESNLFIAAITGTSGGSTATAPTNYSNIQLGGANGGSNGNIISAQRTFASASDDPGVFGNPPTTALRSTTVVVRPGFSIAAMTLPWTAFTAPTVPTVANVMVDAEAISGTITPNTNLIVEVSRNGGANWTAVVLTVRETIGSVVSYQALGVDLTGQPSGSSVVARVRTLNTAAIRVHGLVCLVD